MIEFDKLTGYNDLDDERRKNIMSCTFFPEWYIIETRRFMMAGPKVCLRVQYTQKRVRFEKSINLCNDIIGRTSVTKLPNGTMSSSGLRKSVLN